jgi:hypothetical protein
MSGHERRLVVQQRRTRMKLVCLTLLLLTGGGRADSNRRPTTAPPARGAFQPLHTQPQPKPTETPLSASSIHIGEGWGCAAFASEAGSTTQCWESRRQTTAPGAAAGSIRARPTWAAGEAGPDRLCALADQELRCWHRPRPGQQTPREWPEAGQWLNPRRLTREQAAHPDYAQQAFVGGTFACLRGDDLWCVGDNTYGQLGVGEGSRGVPPLLDIEPVTEVGLGTWHGCARRTGQTLYCWGRADGGQLGAPGHDVCRAGGKEIACARKPQKTPFAIAGAINIRAGDLFTCSNDDTGIVCWGASRDGFFGTAGLCPPDLRAAWPTQGGFVRAPMAACSPVPVTVRGSERFRSARKAVSYDAGPRGLCAVGHDGAVWCAGAISSPRALAALRAAVSPGDDASACAVTREGEVFCWGEGYSPTGAPDRPAQIMFEQPPPNTEAAVVDYGDPQTAGRSCLIQRGCTLRAIKPPPCPSEGSAARPWSELHGGAAKLAGQIVRVSGSLEVGPYAVWGRGCAASECCSAVRRGRGWRGGAARDRFDVLYRRRVAAVLQRGRRGSAGGRHRAAARGRQRRVSHQMEARRRQPVHRGGAAAGPPMIIHRARADTPATAATAPRRTPRTR